MIVVLGRCDNSFYRCLELLKPYQPSQSFFLGKTGPDVPVLYNMTSDYYPAWGGASNLNSSTVYLVFYYVTGSSCELFFFCPFRTLRPALCLSSIYTLPVPFCWHQKFSTVVWNMQPDLLGLLSANRNFTYSTGTIPKYHTVTPHLSGVLANSSLKAGRSAAAASLVAGSPWSWNMDLLYRFKVSTIVLCKLNSIFADISLPLCQTPQKFYVQP